MVAKFTRSGIDTIVANFHFSLSSCRSSVLGLVQSNGPRFTKDRYVFESFGEVFTLTIPQMTFEDSGVFKCSNVQNFNVIVIGLPECTPKASMAEFKESSEAVFQCKVTERVKKQGQVGQ